MALMRTITSAFSFRSFTETILAFLVTFIISSSFPLKPDSTLVAISSKYFMSSSIISIDAGWIFVTSNFRHILIGIPLLLQHGYERDPGATQSEVKKKIVKGGPVKIVSNFINVCIFRMTG